MQDFLLTTQKLKSSQSRNHIFRNLYIAIFQILDSVIPEGDKAKRNSNLDSERALVNYYAANKAPDRKFFFGIR